MELSLFFKVILVQFCVVSIIVWILRGILNRRLIEAAIREFRILKVSHKELESGHIVIISHKELAKRYKLAVLKIAIECYGEAIRPEFQIDKRLWGGLLVRVGENAIDFSLKDRLRQAFPQLNII